LLDGDAPNPGKTRKRKLCDDDVVFSGNMPQTMVKLIIKSDRGFHIKDEIFLLDVQTIRAAIDGEAWAVEKVVEHYSGEIDCLCTKTEMQPDGSMKKVFDEYMRQALIKKLIEKLPKFEAKS